MVRWLHNQRVSPIGIDLGTRSVKLIQFSADHSRVIEAARWDLRNNPNHDADSEQQTGQWIEALKMAREGRNFRGRDAVICLSDRELFLQNIRVPQVEGPEMTQLIQQEAAGRIPFPMTEAEIRYVDAAEIQQGDATLREIIVMACHRPVLEETLQVVEGAGLRPVAVDVEPAAMLRCYVNQYRRDEDRRQRTMYVNVGNSNSTVVIAQGDDLLFVKYADIGGRQMDEAVGRHLKMGSSDAAALRRHNGDRRSDQQDPEITRSVNEAIRPVIESLIAEVSLCVRYNSVTFRGQPIGRLLLGGGEATPSLLQSLDERLNLKCEMSDPLRGLPSAPSSARKGQWDVAAGLALREIS